MKLLIYSILTLCIPFGFIHAQNLVTNGDFEDYSTLPNSSMDWSYCVGWNNVNGSSSAWPYATPDYFHANGSGGGSTPNTAFGDVNPQSGDAIIGLYSRHSSQLNSRDYMSRQLASPMVVGQTYTISFWMTNGYGNRYYGSSCEHMGIQLTLSPLFQAQHENTGGTPQVEAPGEPWLPNWAFYTFSYVCTSPWQYITIGNFHTDAQTAYTIHDGSANYSVGAYYFFDDVRVETANPLPIELVNFDAFSEETVVRTEWLTSSEINNDYFTVERSIDLENWEVIGTLDGAGNSTEEQSYELIDYRPVTGVSYYRLKQTDFDGKETYSDTRSVQRSNYSEPVIHPVPTWSSITVEGDWDQIGDYAITDQMGHDVTARVASTQGPNKYVRYLDLTELSAGIYFFRTENSLKKIIKL